MTTADTCRLDFIGASSIGASLETVLSRPMSPSHAVQLLAGRLFALQHLAGRLVREDVHGDAQNFPRKDPYFSFDPLMFPPVTVIIRANQAALGTRIRSIRMRSTVMMIAVCTVLL